MSERTPESTEGAAAAPLDVDDNVVFAAVTSKVRVGAALSDDGADDGGEDSALHGCRALAVGGARLFYADGTTVRSLLLPRGGEDSGDGDDDVFADTPDGAAVTAVHASASGACVAALTSTGTALVFGADGHQLGWFDQALALQFCPLPSNERALLVVRHSSDDGKPVLEHHVLGDGELGSPVAVAGGVTGAAWSPDGTRVALARTDGTLAVHSIADIASPDAALASAKLPGAATSVHWPADGVICVVVPCNESSKDDEGDEGDEGDDDEEEDETSMVLLVLLEKGSSKLRVVDVDPENRIEAQHGLCCVAPLNKLLVMFVAEQYGEYAVVVRTPGGWRRAICQDCMIETFESPLRGVAAASNGSRVYLLQGKSDIYAVDFECSMKKLLPLTAAEAAAKPQPKCEAETTDEEEDEEFGYEDDDFKNFDEDTEDEDEDDEDTEDEDEDEDDTEDEEDTEDETEEEEDTEDEDDETEEDETEEDEVQEKAKKPLVQIHLTLEEPAAREPAKRPVVVEESEWFKSLATIRQAREDARKTRLVTANVLGMAACLRASAVVLAQSAVRSTK